MLFDPTLSLEAQLEELKKVVAPISPENPAGANLRLEQSGKITEIESLFKVAHKAEKKLVTFYQMNQSNEDVSAPPTPDWHGFLDKACDYIREQSKDLVLATLIAEAGAHFLGIRGFLLGINLMSDLVADFWPTLYPLQDEDSTKNSRFAAWKEAYEWTQTIAPNIGLWAKITSAGTTFAEVPDAMKLEDPKLDSKIREERIKRGMKTVEKIQKEIGQQKEVVFQSLYLDLLKCRTALQKLSVLTREKCTSNDPEKPIPLPDFNRVADSITRLIASAQAVAWPGLLPAESEPAPSSPVEAQSENQLQPSSGTAKTSTSASGHLTRETALAQLKQLATFFRQTEPHSPISYSIDQTVRWGSLSLPELLTELIADQTSRQNLFERTGLPLESPDKQ